MTFPRKSLQISQFLLTGLQPCPARVQPWERLDPRTSSWICSVFTELALRVSHKPWLGPEELPGTWHCAIPQGYPRICGRNVAPCSPWESSAPPLLGMGSSPSSSTDSYCLPSPLPRQENVTHLEHQENCLENAINKLQAQGKQHIQHFAYF